MIAIGKRAASIGAAVAMIASAGPVALADAAPAPAPAAAAAFPPSGPISDAYQAGAAAAIGGLNAGVAGAVSGWNAGAAALGLPFHFTDTSGLFGLHAPGVAFNANP